MSDSQRCVNLVLIRAREIISDEARWIKGYYAKKKDGVKTAASSPYATCWCAVGAIIKATSEVAQKDFKRRLDIEDAAATALDDIIIPKFDSVANFNDHSSTTHKDVLEVFDRAIENTSPANTKE